MIKLQRQAAPASSRFARVRSRSPCIFVFCEQRTRLFLVAVDLPEPRALKIVRAVGDEALHVLRRVAEKQADLVREFSRSAHAAHQLRDASAAAAAGIACVCQQRFRCLPAQIAAQCRRTVEVQKRLSLGEPQRQQAQPAGKIAPVERADLGEQRRLVLARAGKETARLDPGERRRGLPDHKLL